MAQTITIYRREDSNTRPRGFGFEPTYHVDEDAARIGESPVWVWPVEITLPYGYTIGESEDGTHYLYDPNGKYEPIVDDHGHPAIVTGTWHNKAGKEFAQYFRLDR